MAAELQSKLNIASNGTDGNSDFFSCSYSLKTNTITITVNYVCYFFVTHTDKELQTNYGFSVDYDRSHRMSINNVLGNTVEKINFAPDPFVSGFVNLLPMKNIYLTSDSLTNGNQLAPYGVARVLKKIPITAGFGNVIYDNEILMNDANDVSIRHLRRLHFKYVDAYGKTVDLHGAIKEITKEEYKNKNIRDVIDRNAYYFRDSPLGTVYDNNTVDLRQQHFQKMFEKPKTVEQFDIAKDDEMDGLRDGAIQTLSATMDDAEEQHEQQTSQMSEEVRR